MTSHVSSLGLEILTTNQRTYPSIAEWRRRVLGVEALALVNQCGTCRSCYALVIHVRVLVIIYVATNKIHDNSRQIIRVYMKCLGVDRRHQGPLNGTGQSGTVSIERPRRPESHL